MPIGIVVVRISVSAESGHRHLSDENTITMNCLAETMITVADMNISILLAQKSGSHPMSIQINCIQAEKARIPCPISSRIITIADWQTGSNAQHDLSLTISLRRKLENSRIRMNAETNIIPLQTSRNITEVSLNIWRLPHC